MKVRSLVTTCSCGSIVVPTLLLISADSKLIIQGICLGCGEKITARITFKELGDICKDLRQDVHVPKKLLPPLAPVNNDKQWLHELGISNE